MSNLVAKISISSFSSILFIIINLPITYKITNKVFNVNFYDIKNNCPTNIGLLFHAFVFFIVTYLSMSNSSIQSGIKLKHTLYGTLIFYLLSSPAIFSFVGRFIGKKYSNILGCPTTIGILFNAFLYFIFLIAIMYLPEKNK